MNYKLHRKSKYKVDIWHLQEGFSNVLPRITRQLYQFGKCMISPVINPSCQCITIHWSSIRLTDEQPAHKPMHVILPCCMSVPLSAFKEVKKEKCPLHMHFFYNLTMLHFIRFARLHLSVLTTNDKVFNIVSAGLLFSKYSQKLYDHCCH